jgi:transcriptional regulator with XRE-family HTH domain
MSRSQRHPIPDGVGANALEMLGFKDRLLRARTERGWSQSQLAREIWGSMVDERGYTVAKNRDRISAWEGGRAVPDPQNLQKLCDVLGLTLDQLAPDLVAKSIGKSEPEIQITMGHNGNPNLVLLSVRTFTSLATAMKVGTLLAEDKATVALAGAV